MAVKKTETTGRPVVEVTTSWSDTVLDVEQLDTSKGVELYEGVLSVEADRVLLRVPDGAALSVDGDVEPRHVDGEGTLELPRGGQWLVGVGLADKNLWIRPVWPEPYRAKRRPVEWPVLGLVAASLAAHAVLALVLVSAPSEPRPLTLDMLEEDNRFTSYLVRSHGPEGAVAAASWTAERDGDRGRRHLGEEGQMGRRDGARSDQRFGIRGSSDPHASRDRARDLAASAGILATLRSSAPISPLGSRSGDPEGSLGTLMGNQIGDSFGYGGLGTRGTGRGGGSAAGNVGLGRLSTIGHGGGGGTGSGYGRGAGGLRGGRGSPTPAPGRVDLRARRAASMPTSGVLASNFVGGRGVTMRLSDLLDRGVMVDGESVRLEAFQERERVAYEVPGDRAVALHAELERQLVHTEGDTAHLQIALVARQGEAPRRPRMHVILVLDRSGSMASQDKWGSALAAAHALVGRLRPTDTFGLVSYAETATLDVAPRRVGNGRAIQARISRVEPGGGTNIQGALELAAAHAPRRPGPRDMGLIVLISDGQATVGSTSPMQLGALSRSIFDASGVLTTTVGLGTRFDEETMLAIAREGSGSYHFVRRPEDVSSILTDELEERAQAVAQGLRVRVVLAPGVSLRRVYGSRMLSESEHAAVRATEVATDRRLATELGIGRDRSREADEGLRIHIPTFRRGDQHVILMEVELPAGEAESVAQVAQVHLDYKDLLSEANHHDESAVTAIRTGDREAMVASTRRPVRRTVLSFQAGETLQEAARALSFGDSPRARALLAERRELLQTASEAWRDPRLERDARLLGRYETVVARAWPSWGGHEQRTLLLAMNYYGDRRMR